MQQAQEKLKCGEDKILWVDEDAQELHNHFLALRLRGYQVVPCGAYSLGLCLLERHDFDLIVVS